MWKLVSLVIAFLAVSEVIAVRKHSTTATTTASPISNILNKFHQNDYRISYDWSEVVSVDKKFGDFQKHFFKYNRTTPAANATFHVNFDMGYDIEVIAQAYKFASNEYREFPIRFQFNLCDAVSKQTMGFNTFSTTHGNFTCPIMKGKRYHFYNWTPAEAQFPPFIPAGRYVLELQFLYHSKEFLLTKEYGTVYRPFV